MDENDEQMDEDELNEDSYGNQYGSQVDDDEDIGVGGDEDDDNQ